MRSTINVALRQPSLSLQLSLAAAMVARPAARFGGEWAGWCCTYGSETGTLRRVNEQYLSDTAVEYGQVPAGFEECTTESWEDGALVRRSVRLLPETGCAVDNLAAEVSRATLPAAARLAVGARACAVDALAEPGAWRCETVFGGLGGPRPRDRRGAIESSAERTRVAFTFDPQRGALAAVPVVVWQERRWSEAPSLQVKEDRGSRSGLDASWVFAAVGLSCFGGGDGDGAKDETAATERAAAAAERAAAAEQPPLLLALPGGVEVRGEAGRLEVSLFDAEGKAVRLRRAWAGGEVSSEVSSEVE
jgi:hypothetical protein